jgi:hypothetical protein
MLLLGRVAAAAPSFAAPPAPEGGFAAELPPAAALPLLLVVLLPPAPALAGDGAALPTGDALADDSRPPLSRSNTLSF